MTWLGLLSMPFWVSGVFLLAISLRDEIKLGQSMVLIASALPFIGVALWLSW